MNFYTNVSPYGDELLVRYFDNGKRCEDRVPYVPRLYVPTKGKGRYKSLTGIGLDSVSYKSIKDARQAIKRYENHPNFIHGTDRFQYQYMADYWPGNVEYDKDKLRIYTIDIEVESEYGFPNVSDCAEKMICITVKDQVKKQILVWGMADYHVKQDNVHYVKCENEKELLKQFLKFWQSYTPDVLTGWNSKYFDIPYLVKRIGKILGEGAMRRMSPWNIIQEDETYEQGKTQTYFRLLGIAQLDYLQLYRKFTIKNQESYRLDHIGKVELGEQKDDNPYDTFKEWYQQDIQSFIDYNIQDVELVDKLEDRLQLIELALTMAYNAKANYEDVFSQVRMWDTIIFNELLKDNIIVPMRDMNPTSPELVGAYVKDPKVGFHDWVVSFDLNSLYPHLIMQYNISPETILPDKKNVDITDLLDKKVDMSDGNCMAANGTMYRTGKQGFLPRIIQKEYNDRTIYKKKMLEAEQQYANTKDPKYEKLARRYYLVQHSKKISLNSAYGAIGNKYFRYYDHRMAEAITTSGQLNIRWIDQKLNEYFNKLYKTDNEDYIIASDTDSVYINMAPLVKLSGATDKTKIVKALDQFCSKKLEPFITKCYDELGNYMNVYENKMVMKREAIADKGIWTAKKRYILNVHNSEGVQYPEPKLKIMGIEAVKTSTPLPCRDKLKESFKVIMGGDQKEMKEFIVNFRREFELLPPEDIAFPRSVNGVRKYGDSTSIYKKGTPMHVKGALLYNHLLKIKKISHKFQQFYEGDKGKFVHLRKNVWNANVITFMAKLPKEFEMHGLIDYEQQFTKSFMEPLRFILDAINWKIDASDSNTIEDFFA
jgi:DNA polymerase elongation subunit (family B)